MFLSDTSTQAKIPFILVLVDGDGYLFQDSYFKDGGSGGGDAAHRLLSEVRKCVKGAKLQNLQSEYHVMINVYANKRGLIGTLLTDGVISHPNDLEAFFCRFTQSQTHFQFIDCGAGKERVDAKLRGADIKSSEDLLLTRLQRPTASSYNIASASSSF